MRHIYLCLCLTSALFAEVCAPDYPGFNASARTEVCGCTDLFTTASFIYWQPVQENMELGIVSDISNPLDLVNGNVVNLDFLYKPGFQLGIGRNLERDHWDTYLQYTWLRGSHHAHTTLDPTNVLVTLLPAWQISTLLKPNYVEGKEKWSLHMDLLNWDLARTYFVGSQLTFRSFFGGRAAWIRQNLHADYLNVTTAALALWPNTHIHYDSNSWGVGPRIGLETNWQLGYQFRLYGNANADLLFTQYTSLNMTQSSDTPFRNRFIMRQKDTNLLRAHYELLFGFGWGPYSSCNRYFIDLSADYGYQVFFNQNMFRVPSSTTSVGRGSSPNGNLYIHGLTITARLLF